MPVAEDLVVILQEALQQPDLLPDVIARFQRLVWKSPAAMLGLSDEEDEILRTLAYDLDYFVADSKARAEDASYFGPERALSEIRAAMSRLQLLGGEEPPN